MAKKFKVGDVVRHTDTNKEGDIVKVTSDKILVKFPPTWKSPKGSKGNFVEFSTAEAQKELTLMEEIEEGNSVVAKEFKVGDAVIDKRRDLDVGIVKQVSDGVVVRFTTRNGKKFIPYNTPYTEVSAKEYLTKEEGNSVVTSIESYLREAKEEVGPLDALAKIKGEEVPDDSIGYDREDLDELEATIFKLQEILKPIKNISFATLANIIGGDKAKGIEKLTKDLYDMIKQKEAKSTVKESLTKESVLIETIRKMHEQSLEPLMNWIDKETKRGTPEKDILAKVEKHFKRQSIISGV